MRSFYWLVGTLLAVFATQPEVSRAQTHEPDLLNNTWYVYACKDMPRDSGNKPDDCDAEDQLQQGDGKISFLHVEPTHGSAVIVSMKLAEHDDLQVFSGTLERTREVDGAVTQRMIRFYDDAQGPGKAEYKRLHLNVVRTAESDSVDGRKCAEGLEDHAWGTSVFSKEHTEKVCQSKDSNGQHRNVIYWRIGPDNDPVDGDYGPESPPGNGQGSGSEEPPP